MFLNVDYLVRQLLRPELPVRATYFTGHIWKNAGQLRASYVVKIDDDMFLNVDYLVRQLLRPELPVHATYFTGHIWKNAGQLRVYPNDTYPPYCSGPGYVFSADMAKKIYDIAQVIRVIPMEDAFMGICLYELHIAPTASPCGIFNGHRINYNRCQFNKLITVHHYGITELRTSMRVLDFIVSCMHTNFGSLDSTQLLGFPLYKDLKKLKRPCL
ncbi:hypothetical protein AB205_0106420 [Aquarana catesbeiana]|uniref:Hexosyltransferase n=1 Tax=Aquarana catesbeiana TaxID=8400 RepID=A0A2G9SJC0_AQUCT|nr:hypothetical protein AB205_0106420 [Aquarana catesbeiana]